MNSLGKTLSHWFEKMRDHKCPNDGTFYQLSETDKARVSAWLEDHAKKCKRVHAYGGAIGGGFSYIFSPTSVGVSTIFRCRCGKEFNFTCYECW